MPFTAFRVSVPPSVVLPGLASRARVTAVVAPVTVPPTASWTATCTGGRVRPASPSAGPATKASCVAGRGATVTCTVPSTSSTRAVMVTGPPTALAVTTPLIDTEATV
jgi:hypothetical protein